MSFLNVEIKSKGNILNVKSNQITLNKEFEKRLTDKKFIQKDLIEIAKLIKEKITQNILKAKTYKGTNVAPLKPSTIARKGHSRPLFETGKLSKSVVVATDSGSVTVRMAKGVHSKGVTIEEVASYLQAGTTKMKSRPFFGITQKDLNVIVNKVMGKNFLKPSYGYKTVKTFAGLQNRRAA